MEGTTGRDEGDYSRIDQAIFTQNDRIKHCAPIPPEVLLRFQSMLVFVWAVVLENFQKFRPSAWPALSEHRYIPFAGLQCATTQGIFPEVNRAWFTIDSDIFLWDADDGYDCNY